MEPDAAGNMHIGLELSLTSYSAGTTFWFVDMPFVQALSQNLFLKSNFLYGNNFPISLNRYFAHTIYVILKLFCKKAVTYFLFSWNLEEIKVPQMYL